MSIAAVALGSVLRTITLAVLTLSTALHAVPAAQIDAPPTIAAPGPMPTALPAAAPDVVTMPPFPLTGAPPYTAELAGYPAFQFERLTPCAAARWLFGDGTEGEGVCPVAEGGAPVTTTHVYASAGMYHPRLVIRLADGRELTSNTQTVVVATPQPIPWTEPALRWALWGLMLVLAAAAAIWLARNGRRWRVWGWAVIALLLVTYVPPFSYLPSPLAGIAFFTRGFSYDPRLPFANRLLTPADPTAQLRPFLDGLIGQTGLDPLDPVAPLTRYEFVGVRAARGYPEVSVSVRFTYADGESRVYPIPLYERMGRQGWRYDGLGRLRTEHVALPGIPFAGEDAALRLGTPTALQLPDARYPVLSGEARASFEPSYGRQHLTWSPAAADRAFLAQVDERSAQRTLWLLRPTEPPVRIAEDVWSYTWSPDGRYIVFVHGARTMALSVADAAGRRLWDLPVGIQPGYAAPGVTDEGVWTIDNGALWLTPFEKAAPVKLGDLAGLYETGSDAQGTTPRLVRPAPDSHRVAYECGRGLCLQDRNGKQMRRLDVAFSDLTWRSDSSGFVAVEVGWQTPSSLQFVSARGEIGPRVMVTPEGPADAPQWVAGTDWLLAQTYPYGGRRIIAVNSVSGQLHDLSQPRWDAWFALRPDGQKVLLSNARGSFWVSELAVTAR
jgi:hypothetical protein